MSNSRFADTPEPPYYAVIFTSLRNGRGEPGYAMMGERMAELASAMPGYVGLEGTRDNDGFGITVSYWESEAAILAWREHATHRLAQEAGKNRWYEQYELRVAKVERAYAGPAGRISNQPQHSKQGV